MLDTGEKSVEVEFGIERSFIYDILAADISISDALLDLIDNSIDACRRDIQRKNGGKLEELPESYENYEIELKLGIDQVQIKDNCHGIDEHILSRKAFSVGVKDIQDFSIGIYGVGLPRAFWKLGKSLNLLTDNSKNIYNLSVNASELIGETVKKVTASKNLSSGRRSNVLTISHLHQAVSETFADKQWKNNFRKRVSRVFGLCIKKGLSIEIDGIKIPKFGPDVRTDSVAKKLYTKDIKTTSNGVKVKIEAGVHENYIIPQIDPNNPNALSNNKQITQDFGWYVVCNDRIVLVADHSIKVGWTTAKWHTEYNGFVGWVYFESKDASLLPWDTKKTDISLDKISQREIAPLLKIISDNFRSGRKIKNPRKEKKSKHEAQIPLSEPKPYVPPANPHKTSGKPSLKPLDGLVQHPQSYSALLWPCEISTKNKKVIALIAEAQRIPIRQYPYSAAMLLRNLTEAVLEDYLKRTNQWDQCRIEQINTQNKKREKRKQSKLSAEEESRVVPSLSEKIAFLKRNLSLLPIDDQNKVKRNIDNFKSDIGELNGITHEDGIYTNSERVVAFRDRLVTVIEVLVKV